MSKVMEYYENIAREEGRAEGRAEVRRLFAEELHRKDEELAALRAQIAAIQGKKEASLFEDLREGLQEAIDYEKGELSAQKATLTILPADSLSASGATVPPSGKETAFDDATMEGLREASDSDV